MILAKDSITNPFNDWLAKNGIFVAIGVAALLLLILGIIFLISKSKKH